MRYRFRFWFAFALGLVLMAGCSDENGEGGSGGTAGTGGMGGEGGTGGDGVACVDNVCPCTEAGIRAAIAEGGGPFTFDCAGPQTVVTEAEIVIDNDVILNGEGNLTLDGNEDHPVFSVPDGVTAGLHGLTVTKGTGGIYIQGGTLTVTNSTVAANSEVSLGGGIRVAGGVLALINSTVSGNDADAYGGGIVVEGGRASVVNSTVSNNRASLGGGITCISKYYQPPITLLSSTISGNSGGAVYGCGAAVAANTLVDTAADTDARECGIGVSNGGNIESPGDTCGFDQETDQVNVTADDLKLGPLQDNGGPTMTHALGAGSVAIDQIPAEDCVDADGEPLTTDQRGESRPETGGTMCDIGAFELQP
jgi:hypothetical protein